MKRYLLDTNMVSHIILQNPKALSIGINYAQPHYRRFM